LKANWFVKDDETEIDISLHDADAVWAMIEWFYVNRYPSCHDTPDITLHNRIHELALELEVDGLALRAKEEFRTALENLLTVFPEKSKVSCASFRNAITNTVADSDSRAVLLEVLGNAHRMIFANDNVAFKRLRGMLKHDFPELGFEILACMAKKKEIANPSLRMSTPLSMPHDCDSVDHHPSSVVILRPGSESDNGEGTPHEDCRTPSASTLSVSCTANSTDSWVCTSQAGDDTITRRAGVRSKKETQNKLAALQKTFRAHMDEMSDEY
jgi:hypothetical protein